MSGLADLQLKTAYRKGEDDIAEDFYLPCMGLASQYDRAVGFFNSAIYVIAWPPGAEKAMPCVKVSGGWVHFIHAAGEAERRLVEHGEVRGENIASALYADSCYVG